MSAPPKDVLVVEDDDGVAELVRRTLARSGLRARVIDRAGEAVELVRRDPPSLVILDLRLKDGEGWPVLEAAQAVAPRIPVVMVTAMGDERVAAEAIHRGAADYLIKTGSFWEQLPGVAERVLRLAAAERGNAVLASIVEASDDAIVGMTLRGDITSWNPAAQRMYGYTPEEALGRAFAGLICPDGLVGIESALETVRAGRVARQPETRRRRKDGATIEVSSTFSPILNREGRPVGIAAVSRDITERRRLEEELRQAQKMEVVGRLAGGVAHDFNNLLTPIVGYTELLLEELDPAWPFRQELEEIVRSGRRASELTQQLLAFSRKQVLEPRSVDLNQAVAGTEQLIRRLIGEDVRVEYSLAPGAGRIRVDPGRLEQVVMNLAVNARDAMPRGGTLRIATSDEGPAGGGLAVSDDGSGMDAETLSHLFEPFFTTKPKGKGTGLGLAMVYGIVQQSGGSIDVRSEPARGTTFTIRFPRPTEEPAEAPAPAPAPRPAHTGSETILLVEDDTTVRLFAARVLRLKGYRVLEAADGNEALAVSAASTAPIHLLLTDVVMPGLGGRDAAAALRASRPGLRTLFMSGYSDDAVLRRGAIEPGTQLLQKPFTPSGLARKVREALDAPPPS